MVRGLKISHPDRVIDAAGGHTKLDLVRYYDDIASRLLPHLRGRPVSWEQLDEVDGAAHWTMANVRDHLEQRRDDPWADYRRRRQSVTDAMKRLGFEPAPSSKPAKRGKAAMPG